MQKKTLSPEQLSLLKAPLPDEAITQHPTKSYLSSIKSIYVVERLNDVFGPGSWTQTNEIIENSGDHIVLRGKIAIPEYGIELEGFGGNDNGGEGSKNYDRGDSYKGAATDAFTKMCSFLGIGAHVYKGKRSTPHNTPVATGKGGNTVAEGTKVLNPAPDKPWLNPNTPEWKGAIEKLAAGTTTIAKIKMVMLINKADETKLLSEVSKKTSKPQNA